jgi:hypothetical protein
VSGVNKIHQMKLKMLKKSDWSRTALIVCGMALCCLLLVAASGGGGWPDPTYTATVIRSEILDVQVLMDLDKGDLKSARQKLNDDSIYGVIVTLERLRFTTNKAILLKEPTLRAAARYWRDKPYPADLSFVYHDQILSNEVCYALQAVASQLDKGRKGRPAADAEN